ncbi:hypothetical protein [Robertkochia sediminum]|uniref:hypothetical protein n=1 Tax=Robertkochia sediminum TaxID=2785326 RepID=UPI001931B903|nr:hypothetical protein [Robertkochia sediminum]MBL7471250.1 hypothetical protein [Robertkochia sediminum]
MKNTRRKFNFKTDKILLLYMLCLLLCPLGVYAQNQQDDPGDPPMVAKGRFYTNLAFSLDQRNAKNEDQLLREVIDQDKLNFRISSAAGYALKDNFTIGLGLSYGRLQEDITFINEDDQEQTNCSLGHDVSFIPNIRQYVPVNKSFQIFVQADFRFSIGEELTRKFLPNEIEKIEGNFIETRLGVTPGAVLFFNRNWAFETSVGLVGLSSKWSEETVNNDEANRARITENNIDLKVNLLSLNLGVAYYF